MCLHLPLRAIHNRFICKLPNMAKVPYCKDSSQTLSGSHRSGVVGDEKGTGFFIDFDSTATLSDNSDRLTNFRTRAMVKQRPTAEELQQKQKLAAERKKKHEENRVRQARQVSQEAIRFDKKVQARLNNLPKPWFDSSKAFQKT